MTGATGTTPGAAGQTRALLTCGVIAGPLYIVMVVLQMLIRDGFDITRHPASMLSNGDLGWIQIATFAVSGLLFVAYAIGLRRTLSSAVDPAGQDAAESRGTTWGPRLVGVFGAGMLGAAIFSADPADGFPPGTPTGPPTTVSLQGMLHFLVAGVGFVALIIACFVFARRFRATHDQGWALFSTVTGTLFLATWISIFAFQGAPAANIAFALGIALALAWTSLLAAHLLARPEQ